MTTIVNGEARVFEAGITLADALRALGVEAPGIAVAVNAAVVPRARFTEHRLRDGDAVEIIRAVAGG